MHKLRRILVKQCNYSLTIDHPICTELYALTFVCLDLRRVNFCTFAPRNFQLPLARFRSCKQMQTKKSMKQLPLPILPPKIHEDHPPATIHTHTQAPVLIIYFSLIAHSVPFFFPSFADILRPVLRGGQPVQKAAHLHREDHGKV